MPKASTLCVPEAADGLCNDFLLAETKVIRFRQVIHVEPSKINCFTSGSDRSAELRREHGAHCMLTRIKERTSSVQREIFCHQKWLWHARQNAPHFGSKRFSQVPDNTGLERLVE